MSTISNERVAELADEHESVCKPGSPFDAPFARNTVAALRELLRLRGAAQAVCDDAEPAPDAIDGGVSKTDDVVKHALIRDLRNAMEGTDDR